MSFNLVSRATEGDFETRRTRFNLSEVNTVGELVQKAATVTQIRPESIQLLFRGILLKSPEQTLAQIGLRANATIYILKAPVVSSVEPMGPKDLSDEEMKRFFVAFGMAIRNPALNVALKRLTQRENLESLAGACPGLAQDPMALAFLNKPEMLMMLLKPEILQRVAQEHPSLHEAMVNLAAAVHEERPSKSSQLDGESLPTPFSYHLDDMSDVDDDEDMEEDGFGSDLQRNRSFSAITPNQLAAAIAAAQNSAGASTGNTTAGALGGLLPNSLGVESTPGSSTGSSMPSSSRPTPSSPAITSDSFRQALEQAMAASGQVLSQNQSSSSLNAASEPMEASDYGPEQIEKDVATMRELGIVDEGLAQKALKLMGGDLQAAIDLVFSGWLGEDDAAS
ncbi:hypothetical protein TCAL_00811 [Tigriopus californicus]|uniref:UBA domain-containing protein n=1 Tax=Tigriopus californicus TaxID=6832 RepID=A0A553NBD6_TIGCA|nr:ubiquitin-like protein 7 [Tigriopus californicus]TRY62738.1 hypothetical protein TCAL_00811 [Tigriopus californicus]|eukprot:TCALIF_00811-PA protein Name:"Similar to UBL7 Ubiquitin-like protein 7 (Bos taurus)" AED:0.03 eAED:0.03 QI:166/1/1/1/1/1/2/68/394